MRLAELLLEKKVQSTWISELIHNRPARIVTMKLSDGKVFSIMGIPRSIFDRWNKSPSKGQFWHESIKGKHKVTRVN